MSKEPKLVSFPKRKPLPNSIRFAVFKRDAFTCQYCGGKAPDVILHVDHIRPVADGGENEIVNLITSCAACNFGKRAEPLDENLAIAKQRKQIDELNERRNQLEMMVEWRESLRDLEADHVQAIQNEFLHFSRYTANETGERDIRKWLKKYSLQEILDAIGKSFSQYLILDEDNAGISESWDRAFNMVPRIAAIVKRGGMPPEKMRLFYIRGILRRRFDLTDYYEWQIIHLLQEAVDYGIDLDFIESFAKSVSSKTKFQESIIDFINENSDDRDDQD